LTTSVTIREFARLTTSKVPEGDLDFVSISASAFDWLCDLSARFNRSGATLLQVEGRRSTEVGQLCRRVWNALWYSD